MFGSARGERTRPLNEEMSWSFSGRQKTLMPSSLGSDVAPADVSMAFPRA